MYSVSRDMLFIEGVGGRAQAIDEKNGMTLFVVSLLVHTENLLIPMRKGTTGTEDVADAERRRLSARAGSAHISTTWTRAGQCLP